MKSIPRLIFSFTALFSMIAALPAWAKDDSDKIENIYQTNCASCHGEKFEGGLGGSLVDGEWKYGGSDEEIARSIAKGHPKMGMQAWEGVLKPDQIRAMVVYLREKEAENSQMSKPQPKLGETTTTKYESYKTELVTDGLKAPWSMAFLPDGRRLITEKNGPLRIADAEGKLLPEAVKGTPQVMDHGQGGMLAVVRGKIKDNTWVGQEWIYQADKKFYTGAGVHFGSRIVFDKGYVFFVVGERGGGMEAQDVHRPNGKIFRLFDDGRVPPDNPFVNDPEAEKGIWSYGHRNPQGLTKDPRDGAIYETEHGPRGGDEFNKIVKGGNYGWPVITYGMNYDGRPMTAITAKEGMEQPISHWTPSIAACGLAIYTGDEFPKWKGDFFAGSLRAQELHRLRVKDGKLIEEEVVLKNIGRIRDVENGPDGMLYLVLNGPDQIVRLVPAK